MEDGPDFDSQCFAHRLIDRQGGRVGCDGHSDIFELRPKFSTNPKLVVENTKKCFETLGFVIASAGKPVYLMTGGGIIDSIGGHIHIGGNFFQNISTDEIGSFFGNIMDDFVYWPIRDRMPGAMRAWGNHPTIGRRRSTPPNTCGFPDKKPVVIFDKITKAEKKRDMSFAGYEGPGAFRWTSYGFEYRSLPSFIAGPELTELILTMAQSTARKMVKSYNTGEGFVYNVPPKKSDYLGVFTEDIYHRFGRYINGDKNKIFLTNALENWGVGTTSFHPVIKVCSDVSGDSLYHGIELTKKLNKFLRKVFSENEKALKGVNVIDISMNLNEMLSSPYVCRCGTTFVLADGCHSDMTQFGGQRDPLDGVINVRVMSCPEDCPTDVYPIIDAIALALCTRIGNSEFGKLRRVMMSILKTFTDPPNAEFIIVKRGEKDEPVTGHGKLQWTDEEISEYFDCIGEEDCLCEDYRLVSGCRCMYCTAIRDFRDENCGPCGNEECLYYPREEEEEEF